MHIDHVRRLGGPNIFTTGPVAIARLELEDLAGRETTDFPGFAERLVMALPGLRDHHCASGQRGGFTNALARGTYLGHVVEHLALELSALAGREVNLGRTLWAGADGRYDVVTECPRDEPEDSAVPSELFDLAITMVGDLLGSRRPEVAVPLAAIGRSVERERLGPSTAAIAAAARRRDIPVRRIGGTSMLRLGYGRHRCMVSAALTGDTSALGTDIACDKLLAKQLIRRAGIPVPAGVMVCGAAEAVAALARLSPPLVVKPRNGNQGSYVTIGVRTAAEMEQAYRHAAAGAGSCAVIVEEYAPGQDYRVLIVDGRVAAAAQLRPPQVTGDGIRTIGELIDEVNADPRRGDGHSRVLTKIDVDDTLLAHLAATGLDLGCVPAERHVVTLRRNGNLSTGGTSKDVTDLVHPDFAELCRRAAGVAGLDVCGVDLRAEDIAAPLFGREEHQAAAVIEINACPGLRMHLAPDEGTPRDVAEAIVDRLYPPGASARVPIIAVTGSNGKTTTVRMIEHILRRSGLRTGLSSTDGVFVAGQCVQEADASGPRSAEIVLDDPAVEAAVLETARGGIVRRGLGYDRADVAVITNIAADHLGDDDIDDLDELIGVKSLVAEEIADGGSLVLNADDKATAAIADRPRVRKRQPVIRYVSVNEPGVPADGFWYQVVSGHLTETAEGRALPVLDVTELPGAFGGRARHVVANALAAIAACRAVGVSVNDIAAALRTFTPCEANPGRGNVYAVAAGPDATTPAGPVLLDYGHNAAALLATGQMVAEVWPGAATAVLTLPGDRRDDLIVASAQAVAARFATVVIYEDQDLRGRRPGEMRELIESSLRQASPGIRVVHADGPAEALRTAVSLAAGGPVLFVYEKLTAARAALDDLGATPWPEEDLLGHLVSGQVLDDIAREFALGTAETMPLPEPPSQRKLST